MGLMTNAKLMLALFRKCGVRKTLVALNESYKRQRAEPQHNDNGAMHMFIYDDNQ